MKIFKNISDGYKKIATGIAIVSFLVIVYIALIPGGSVAVVVNALGVGIGGATVKLADYPQYNDITSDGTDGRALGEYTIQQVPYGSYFMMTTHPDYAPNISSVNVSSVNTAKDITLKVCDNRFSDVSCTDWYYVYVMYLFDNGITTGKPDGTFAPNAQITRAELATFIVRARGLTYTGGLSDFPDVPGPSNPPAHWAYQYVMAARQNNIVNGRPDGTFAPDDPVTRAEAATMISRARGWTYSGNDQEFTDISTHWAKTYIMALKEKKVVGGYPDGTFRPDNPSTRAENGVMITKMNLWY